jgi:protein required for attachment to host cells
MKNWFVVANAARARVLEQADPPRPGPPARTAQGSSPNTAATTARKRPKFVHVADLVHPQSRQKGLDLASDRPGRVVSSGHGPGSASYPPRTDPREREHDRFALEVARLLDHGVADGRCAGLVLVASDPFLGRLKSHLGEQARKAVLRTVAADYTELDEAALAQRLAGDEEAT